MQVTDDFTGTNGSLVGSRTGWSPVLSSMTVNGNQAGPANSGGGPSCARRTESFTAHHFAEAVVRQPGSRQAGVAVCCQSGASTYYAWLGQGSFETSKLTKVVAGTATILATSSQAVAGDVFALTVEFVGGNAVLTCYRNGVIDASIGGGTGIYTDSSSPILSGNPGIAGNGSENVSSTQVDDFRGGDFADFAGSNEPPEIPVNDWVELTPTPTRPPGYAGTIYPRPWSASGYDPVTGENVFYEGYEDGDDYTQSIYSNTIFGYHHADYEFRMKQPHNWTNLTPGSGYSIDELPANATDPTPPDSHPNFAVGGGFMYQFGGVNSNIAGASGASPEGLWRINLATREAELLTITGDIPRGKAFNFAMSIDTSRNILMIVSPPNTTDGTTYGTYLIDLDTLVGTRISGAPPTVQAGCCLTYDASRDRQWLIGGGYDHVMTLRYFDCAAETWHTVTPLNAGPSARVYHIFAYIPVEDVILLHGGSSDWNSDDDADFLADTWQYDPLTNRWSEVQTAVTPTRTDVRTPYGSYNSDEGVFILKADATLYGMVVQRLTTVATQQLVLEQFTATASAAAAGAASLQSLWLVQFAPVATGGAVGTGALQALELVQGAASGLVSAQGAGSFQALELAQFGAAATGGAVAAGAFQALVIEQFAPAGQADAEGVATFQVLELVQLTPSATGGAVAAATHQTLELAQFAGAAQAAAQGAGALQALEVVQFGAAATGGAVAAGALLTLDLAQFAGAGQVESPGTGSGALQALVLLQFSATGTGGAVAAAGLNALVVEQHAGQGRVSAQGAGAAQALILEQFAVVAVAGGIATAGLLALILEQFAARDGSMEAPARVVEFDSPFRAAIAFSSAFHPTIEFDSPFDEDA